MKSDQMKSDQLRSAKALRVFCKEDDIAQAAAGLCEKAKEIEALPCAMTFEQSVDYEVTGEYQLILWCT